LFEHVGTASHEDAGNERRLFAVELERIVAQLAVENLFEPDTFGAWASARYDLVLLDPPRAGASALLATMAQWRPRRVVYISCHPGSLARDAEILVHHHGFVLTEAGVMDMFPHTTHVESIAVFENRS
jgi:23S rRNA (uracil1939-C5)-methyltransferase